MPDRSNILEYPMTLPFSAHPRWRKLSKFALQAALSLFGLSLLGLLLDQALPSQMSPSISPALGRVIGPIVGLTCDLIWLASNACGLAGDIGRRKFGMGAYAIAINFLTVAMILSAFFASGERLGD